jgi:hypothetical protein
VDRKALERRRAELKHINIEDKVENTFGPNPCTTLHLQTDDGDHLNLTCDRKRCVDCGPRKKLTIQLQMQQGFGDNAYITTYTDRITLDRDIERTRKAARRSGHSLLLQSVGDDTLGYIVVSDRPIHTGQRLTTLSDWTRRILDTYHHSVRRIRRSYALGRVSLVTLYRKSNSGQASPWWRKTVASEGWAEVQDLDWDTMLAETEFYEDVLLVHKPDLSLPVPF